MQWRNWARSVVWCRWWKGIASWMASLTEQVRADLALELSDLQVMLFKIAYLCDIDMESAMMRGQAKADRLVSRIQTKVRRSAMRTGNASENTSPNAASRSTPPQTTDLRSRLSNARTHRVQRPSTGIAKSYSPGQNRPAGLVQRDRLAPARAPHSPTQYLHWTGPEPNRTFVRSLLTPHKCSCILGITWETNVLRLGLLGYLSHAAITQQVPSPARLPSDRSNQLTQR